MEINKILGIPSELLLDSEKLLLLKMIQITSSNSGTKITLKDLSLYLGWEKSKTKRVAKSLKIKNILEPVKISLEEDSLVFNYKIHLAKLEELVEGLVINTESPTRPQNRLRGKYAKKRKVVEVLNTTTKKISKLKRLDTGGKLEKVGKRTLKKLKKEKVSLLSTLEEDLLDIQENVAPTRNVKIMINYWNQFDCLRKVMEFKRGEVAQSDLFKKVVKNCRDFLSGDLYKVKREYFPEDLDPLQSRMTVEDFKIFVDRFVAILTDKNLKPINKNYIGTNANINTFLAGNNYVKASSLLLEYCLKEPETVIQFINPEKDINIMRDSWKKLNPSYVFSGKDLIELDKFLNYAMINIKSNKKFKPRMGSVVSKIGDVVIQTIQKNWGRGKITTLKPLYLNTNHFKFSFEAMIKRLGY